MTLKLCWFRDCHKLFERKKGTRTRYCSYKCKKAEEYRVLKARGLGVRFVIKHRRQPTPLALVVMENEIQRHRRISRETA